MVDDARAEATTLFLMVGLPGAGKTTLAVGLAKSHPALRLTPDEWHLPLFGTSLTADGKRDVLEAQLITVAFRAIRLGISVILDFGLWGRDERSALRWLASEVGAQCQVVYVPVELEVQLARIAHRENRTRMSTSRCPNRTLFGGEASSRHPSLLSSPARRSPRHHPGCPAGSSGP